mmetsp:Transcript_91054/g.228953  ORF Transcript_91054/g.228953 Transcript_91054/m.228953 type:complete len:425 (-) Transcript_91054:673-1947(-)
MRITNSCFAPSTGKSICFSILRNSGAVVCTSALYWMSLSGGTVPSGSSSNFGTSFGQRLSPPPEPSTTASSPASSPAPRAAPLPRPTRPPRLLRGFCTSGASSESAPASTSASSPTTLPIPPSSASSSASRLPPRPRPRPRPRRPPLPRSSAFLASSSAFLASSSACLASSSALRAASAAAAASSAAFAAASACATSRAAASSAVMTSLISDVWTVASSSSPSMGFSHWTMTKLCAGRKSKVTKPKRPFTTTVSPTWMIFLGFPVPRPLPAPPRTAPLALGAALSESSILSRRDGATSHLAPSATLASTDVANSLVSMAAAAMPGSLPLPPAPSGASAARASAAGASAAGASAAGASAGGVAVDAAASGAVATTRQPSAFVAARSSGGSTGAITTLLRSFREHSGTHPRPSANRQYLRPAATCS